MTSLPVVKAQPVGELRELEESLEGKGYLDAGDIVVLQMKLNAIRQGLEYSERERLGWEGEVKRLEKEKEELEKKVKYREGEIVRLAIRVREEENKTEKLKQKIKEEIEYYQAKEGKDGFSDKQRFNLLVKELLGLSK